MKNRTDNSIKNIKYAIIGQFFAIIINLISRTVFVKSLSSEYLGLSSLFTNILTILSLTDLGFGTAMSYQLYRPLAENDIEKIKSLMNLYRKIYIIISIVIAVLGLLCVPLYPYLINEIPNIDNLDLIYVLFVINTSFSYLFAYKRLLVIGDQKQYITTFYKYLFYFILNVLQIIELIILKNYILFLFIQIIITLFENISISIKVNKLYPYLKDKNIEKVPKSVVKEMKYNVKSMFFHKFGGVVLNSTDNIVISKCLGLTYVGLYSNYLLITNALNTILSQLFSSVIASIGNLDATSGKKAMTKVFDKVFFMDFWIHCVCTICLICLFNPFIELWIGANYTINDITVVVIAINFYLFGMRKTAMSFREATGNYHSDRFSPIIEAILNIGFSIILSKYLGLTGVIMGTIISCLCTNFWWEPLVVCKKSLEKNVFKYFKDYFKYTIIGIIIAIITIYINSFIKNTGLIYLMLRGIISFVVPNILLVLFFIKNEYLIFYKNLVITKIIKRNK